MTEIEAEKVELQSEETYSDTEPEEAYSESKPEYEEPEYEEPEYEEPEYEEPEAEEPEEIYPDEEPEDELEYEEKPLPNKKRPENRPHKLHKKHRKHHSKAKEKAYRRQKMCDSIYIFFAFIIFVGITVAMLILPRSTSSALEKRNLEKFPEFSVEAYFKGDFTDGISTYFSDTVPYRDELMTLSTLLTDKRGIKTNITIHGTAAVVNNVDEEISESEESGGGSEAAAEEEIETTEATTEYTNQQIADAELADLSDEKYTVVNNGIAVVGTRALMLYGGSTQSMENYAATLNKVKDTLGDDVTVYSMVIPTACEFYATPEIKQYITSQLDSINREIECLEDVKAVNVYTTLANHRDEDIYLRTDHHWAPLGAYYAAKEFAAAAGVDFKDISEYNVEVNPGCVGSMYSYSGDVTLKNNPEDFVYYVPKEKDYTVTYYNYQFNGSDISGLSDPFEGDFFIDFPDGSSDAYCTFMGGDGKVVHVHSDAAGNGRKLGIIKDSYGNAVPAYLLSSFEDIYVIDMRYFTYNLPNFVKSRGITDLLFANNVFHAASQAACNYYEEFLTQPDGLVW
ncbi:MAG: hypothetical protein LIO44_03370 [Eubacterium sp.]|nr:hypothetical protein [Eubacterium sp.]